MARDTEIACSNLREIRPDEAVLISGGRSEGGCVIPPGLADLLKVKPK
ncbi:hypothetical protein [Paracoccus haematequi]|nr:hypothetical protein [Paracoccus haematequi]